MKESSRAPPTTTSVPCFGPTSCAETAAAAATQANAPSNNLRIRIPLDRGF